MIGQSRKGGSMASNNELDTGMLEIPATVYPGMFDREFQVAVNIRGREIIVIVSGDDVIFAEARPSETGSKGRLRVFLVDADDRGFLFDLPGEPLGISRRFRISNKEAEQLFAVT
jgi:hypothetical protein